MLSEVKQYTDAGFNPIPIALDGSKRAAVAWGPYQTQRATDAEVATWFKGKGQGIGIVCGPISGNLLAIDFDKQAGQTYPQWLELVRQQLPELADRLAVVETPRPGYHVWLKTKESEPPGPQILAYSAPEPRVNDQDSPCLDADGQPILEPGVLIEIRGRGNYVIAPGSPDATHPTGKRYQWLQGGPTEVTEVSDSDLAILLDAARQLTQYTPQHVQKAAFKGKRYSGEPRPGDVFNQHADLLHLLQHHGWQEHHRAGDVVHLTRPGKDRSQGTSATLGALRSMEARPLLYVFSSAASPFQPNQTYDAFAAYTWLEHGGDYSRAASAAKVLFAQQVQEAQRQWHITHSSSSMEYEPFPVELMPDPIRQYVTEHAEAINIDAAFVAVPMLSVLAALIGQARRVRIKQGWTEPSVLWSVVVNPSGGGKSPGFKAATKLAHHIEGNHQSIRAQKHKEHLDQVRQWKAANDKTQPKPEPEPFHRQMLVNDATMETIISIHSHNWKGLLLASDELNGWLSSFNTYRGGQGRDVPNWLSIADGGEVVYGRKTNNQNIYIPTTAISVTGGIQPSIAEKSLFTHEFIQCGLAGRFLIASPPFHVVRWSDAVVSEAVIQDAKKVATKLYDLSGCDGWIEGQPFSDTPTSLEIGFIPEAQKRLVKNFDSTADLAEQMADPQRTLFLKLRPAAARIALVFSIVEQVWAGTDATSPIELHSLEAGIQIAQWFAREVARNYTKKRKNSLLAHLGWIQQNHPLGIDARKLQQGIREISTADQARDTLQQLVEEGYGRFDGQTFVPN